MFYVAQCHCSSLASIKSYSQMATSLLFATMMQSCRCQKYHFCKVKESDIVVRLQSLSTKEELQVDLGALQLIASRADGSVRDAEITLDQLSLLDRDISLALVQELVSSSVHYFEGLLSLFSLSSEIVPTLKQFASSYLTSHHLAHSTSVQYVNLFYVSH